MVATTEQLIGPAPDCRRTSRLPFIAVMPERNPQEFALFARNALSLLHELADSMSEDPQTRDMAERDPEALLADVMRAVEELSGCSTEEEAKAVLARNADLGPALCGLNAELSPPAQVNALRRAFDRTPRESLTVPPIAFAAYLTAMCDLLTLTASPSRKL